MSSESLLVAGILLVLVPTVFYGGAAILSTLAGHPGYAEAKPMACRPSPRGRAAGTLACDTVQCGRGNPLEEG